jgi:hypothetical protein
MSKFALSMLLVLLVSMTAFSQEFPRAELFGGYSFMRSDGANYNGWMTSITENANHFVGIKGEISGNYRTDKTSGVKLENWLHTVALGPQFAYRKSKVVTPFFDVMVGATNRRFKVSPADPAFPTVSNTVFAAIFGGGVDVNIFKSCAFRALQMDYILNRTQGSTINNFRFSAGFVYRFAWK